MKTLLATIAVLLLTPALAAAQTIDLGGLAGGLEGSTIGYIIQIFGLLTILSIAPGILIMVTSFTRFIIVFSILRAGMGLPTTPANLILISLALFMTFYVMSPTFDRAWNDGVQPLIAEEITEQEAVDAHRAPFRDFMMNNVREKDFDLFADLARERGDTDISIDKPGSAHSRPGLHDLRDQARLRDRLPDRAALPGHRPDRGHHHHVDGHDDAAADRGLAPLQGAVLRADRRLEPARRQPRALVRLNPLSLTADRRPVNRVPYAFVRTPRPIVRP
jgi:hypothetical protein